jgi:hypothetical protein
VANVSLSFQWVASVHQATAAAAAAATAAAAAAAAAADADAAGVVLRRFSRLVQGRVLVRDLASIAYDGVPEVFDAAG